ncbi:MAG: prepilin peptidase [Cyanobacteriota bacterium]
MALPAPALITPGLLPPALVAVPLALFGACIGSFLNVVAWRLPRQESVVWPGSHCPRCGTDLAWFENVPVLSWLLLRGRCRHCHQPIAARYPLVELLCSGLWVTMLVARPQAMGAMPPSTGLEAWLLLAAGGLLASWLLPLVLIDLDSMWLPEPLCRWGVVLGLAVTAALGGLQGEAAARALLLSHLIACGAGLLGFELLSALAEKAFGRPALGLGDAKLAALMGAWLGPLGLALAVGVAIFSGALVGVAGRLSGRLGPHQPFPFGPFLAIGTLAVWIGGHGPWLQLAGLGS